MCLYDSCVWNITKALHNVQTALNIRICLYMYGGLENIEFESDFTRPWPSTWCQTARWRCIWWQHFKGTSDGEYRHNCWQDVRYFVCPSCSAMMSLKGVMAVEPVCVCVCVVVGEALESLSVIGVRGSCVPAFLCKNRPAKQLNPPAAHQCCCLATHCTSLPHDDITLGSVRCPFTLIAGKNFTFYLYNMTFQIKQSSMRNTVWTNKRQNVY